VDRRAARSLCRRGGPQRRGFRRHLARRQSLPHRKRQGHGILRAPDALHLVAGSGRGRRALRGHGRPGQGLPRFRSRPRRTVLRYRPVAHHRPGRGFRRPGARGHGAQWHSLPHFRQGQGLCPLRCQPAGNPRHRSHAGRHGVCRRAGRLRGQTGAKRRASRAGHGRRRQRDRRNHRPPLPRLR
jgi:hypothetical protein